MISLVCEIVLMLFGVGWKMCVFLFGLIRVEMVMCLLLILVIMLLRMLKLVSIGMCLVVVVGRFVVMVRVVSSVERG